MKVTIFVLACVLFSMVALGNDDCILKVYRHKISSIGLGEIYVAKKTEVALNPLNEGWTNAGLSYNKKLVLTIEGCSVFVGKSNNFDFIKDSKASLDSHIGGLNSSFVVIDLTNLSIDSTGGLISLEVEKDWRIHPAEEYLSELTKQVNAIGAFISGK